MTEQQIQESLSRWQDPWLRTDWVSANAIKTIRLTPQGVFLEVILGYPFEKEREFLKAGLEKYLAKEGIALAELQLTWKVIPHQTQLPSGSIPGVKNIIAVASGKGGVGKSTTAVNLAVALVQEGASVGLLDADIHGPNIPIMLGTQGSKPRQEDKMLLPIEAYGLKTMSMGYLLNQTTPAIWRGPMVSSALEQLLTHTQWGKLDYLIVDLPPGTGDIQLTLSKKIPVSGAVIISTPQPVALLDARKGLEMFRKVDVFVVGIVENMSHYECSHCGQIDHLFGEAGAQELAKAGNTQVLGHIPLQKRIREQADLGKPLVAADPESAIAQTYRATALCLTASLSLRPKNYGANFPRVVVE